MKEKLTKKSPDTVFAKKLTPMTVPFSLWLAIEFLSR
jgi:hypothetical protein